ncbi:CDP-diacylglycerol--glycerol-3-phosphate 3-phosphatidyltransferase [Granulicatella balaenopterae]|uniref:CDP-diacylglycerol--glycerol-3-phosphate 3-phosphatidyltransferase n=1 Tax=Granulicatella balaenopterae TaxID=137733 RepID=A0A1H9K8I9_9LACT|nr:CDP-diacylglycerol--glycerol-3-phosphate 3-phosphatidyltransferase [Granulicatella balaenopterae]SEQ95247.1 CDP-diacylglycerol--glycerol-3-phosphate 3-phosphatidyltransferase [Granulicatella balaenopterae]
MNLPNKLTILRILMIPLFILVVSFPSQSTWNILSSQVNPMLFLAMVIFALASITDFLDGAIARKYHLVTNFGKFADPMADKMLVMTAFISLVSLDLAPAWVVSIIICRELAVTGLRILLVTDGEVLAAAWPGKVKTATQMFAIIFLLIDDLPFKAIGLPIGTILLYVCLFFTVYSGADYFIKNKHVFKDSFE